MYCDLHDHDYFIAARLSKHFRFAKLLLNIDLHTLTQIKRMFLRIYKHLLISMFSKCSTILKKKRLTTFCLYEITTYHFWINLRHFELI